MIRLILDTGIVMARVDVSGPFDYRFNYAPGPASTITTFGNSSFTSTNLEQLRVDYTDSSRTAVTGFTISEFGNGASVKVSGLSFDNGLVDRYLVNGKYQSLLKVAEGGNDTVVAATNTANLVGGGGNDFLVMGVSGKADGGEGTNTIQVNAGYTITQTGEAAFTLTNGANIIQASDIQRIKSGTDITAFDISGNAGQVFRLYQAAFNRTPDGPGLSVNVDALDHGATLKGLAASFISSPEFTQKYGANPSNETFVTSLYFNVLHRAPDAGGFAAYTNALNAGALDKSEALRQFSESLENHVNIDPVIAVGIHLDSSYMQLG